MTGGVPAVVGIDRDCSVCKGCGWVCEEHQTHPSDVTYAGPGACGAGPGLPCECNPFGEVEWAEVHAALSVADTVALYDRYGWPGSHSPE